MSGDHDGIDREGQGAQFAQPSWPIGGEANLVVRVDSQGDVYQAVPSGPPDLKLQASSQPAQVGVISQDAHRLRDLRRVQGLTGQQRRQHLPRLQRVCHTDYLGLTLGNHDRIEIRGTSLRACRIAQNQR